MNIPTREEISPYGDPDEEVAAKNFLGKDLAQAEKLFGSSFKIYSEDLMWMGERAFCYYARAAMAYVRSEESRDDDSVIIHLSGVIDFQLDYDGDCLKQSPVLGELRSIVAYVLDEWQKFTTPWEDGEEYKKSFVRVLRKLDDVLGKDG